MSMIRTFVALEISKEIRARTSRLIGRLNQSGAEANWVTPENLHLTMTFLGDVNDVAVHEVCMATQDVVRQYEPFEVQCRGTGAFPRLESPRVFYVAVHEGFDAMVEMQRDLTNAFRDIGFQKEKGKYQPHLTIGRMMRGKYANDSLKTLLEKHSEFDAGSAIVNEAVVYSSQLEPSGPIYTPLSRISFA